MIYWITYSIAYILIRLLFRLEVKGEGYIPKKGPFIIASNHRSYLDPPTLAVSIRRKLCFLTKSELFKTRLSSFYFKQLNCVALDREGIDRRALKEGLRALHSGSGLLVFPEGTRSKDGRIGPAKNGIAMFAIGARVPVIPAFIGGTEKALSPNTRSIKFVKAKVVFGKPLVPPVIDRLNKKSAYQDFTDRIMGEIARLEGKAA
jgi:1-acyl-sn-glycerol-3-phosphate acyltransferase